MKLRNNLRGVDLNIISEQYNKVLLCIISLFIATSICHGSVQDSTKERKNEIGLGVTNVLSYFGTSLPQNNYFLSVYKRNYDNKAFRSGLSISGNIIRSDFIIWVIGYIGNQCTIVQLAKNKIRFYGGIDGIIDYSTHRYTAQQGEERITYMKLGTTPLLGLQYDMLRRFAVSMETDIFGYYYKYQSSANPEYSHDGWFIDQFRVLYLSLYFKFK